MSNTERQNNPERYSEMCAPRQRDEADAALVAFFQDVTAARLKHRIADVHVVARVVMHEGDGEVSGFASAHIGAEQEAEGMCGWAFARAAETRRDFVDHMKSQGARAGRKARAA